MKGSVEMLREKGISRKVCAIVCSIVMALSLLGAGITVDTITANADGVVTAKITYTAQFDGAFQDVKLSTPVASDTAERYGYEDAVAHSAGVSMLDVWVQIHADLYPEFSQANREEYFAIGDGQYGKCITNAFKKGGMNCGYYINGSSPARQLYEPVKDGDVVDAWYLQDTTTWSDAYTFFKDVSKTINESTGNEELSGKAVASTWSGETELSNVELGWLNLDTLEILPIICSIDPFETVKTDEEGCFTITMPITSNYLLTVRDGTFGNNNTPIVRTLCVDYPPVANVVTSSKTAEEKLESYASTGDYIANNIKSLSCLESADDEWYALGLGRAGYPVSSTLYPGYYDSVKAYISGNRNNYKASGLKMASPASNGYFDSVVDCAKVVIALNAIGYDPTNMDGVDITSQLNDVDNVNRIWDCAYTLIALDTKNYPSSARETYISRLLEAQFDNGAWSHSAVPDIDTTGIVLAALAPYYNSNSSVKAAVDRALEFLSNVQAPSGAFYSGADMDENANSTAMVVLGLSELGINPDTDSRFIKNGVSAVDALCSFAVKGGGFGWKNNTDVNEMATYQAYYALCSYFRLINGMNRLFDMTPEKNISSDAKQASAPTTTKVSSVPKTGDKLIRFI